MFPKLRSTLRQVFALSLLGLLLGLILPFTLIFKSWKQTIQQSSERLREIAATSVATHVTDYLNQAPGAVTDFEKQIRHGLVDPSNPDSLEAGLLSLLLANHNISEATFTYANSTGFDADESLQVDKASAGQVSVFGLPEGGFASRRTRYDGTQFVARTIPRLEIASGSSGVIPEEIPAMDPTTHATFTTPTIQKTPKSGFYGDLLWTDLHWSQLDEALPENKRRVELSVMKAIENTRSKFAGVLRIGLMKEQIDNAVKLPAMAPGDPHLAFLCDNEGRLITGFSSSDRVSESRIDLRIASDHIPPQVTAALLQPVLKTVGHANPAASIAFPVGSETYLCTFKALPETQDWIVGIVVPEDFYLGKMLRVQRQILWISLALVAAIIAVGSLILHGIGRAHALIVRETTLMNAFEFSPSANSSRLRDIGEVLAGLERAKTAMRSMGKYVPVDLVRRLYHGGEEPVLGGEAMDITLLFSDIKDFTPFAEEMKPDKLAGILGGYLQVMATMIQGEKGTIDKYIGDSVMAFWNAPEPVAGHPTLACRAALRCRAALLELYDSPAWNGMPHFETRFGLHHCVVSVGHFGAPDRFNYTAIGDGVNLGSRLEGLNKYYETTIIASETVHAETKEQFEFRLLDRVAVKGKMQGIAIYELIGERTPGTPRDPAIVNYEGAFEVYQRADFLGSLALLEKYPDDPPSRLLAVRCRNFIENPPQAEWNGIRIFESK